MKRTSQPDMEVVVASFKSSGQSQREFCSQQQIKLATFSYWYRKVKSASETPAAGFTEVTSSGESVGLENENELFSFPSGTLTKLQVLEELTREIEIGLKI